MKPLLASVLLGFSFAPPGRAEVLVEELFDYADALPLSGRKGGAGFTEGWWTGRAPSEETWTTDASGKLDPRALGGQPAKATGTLILRDGALAISGQKSVWGGRAFTPIAASAVCPAVFFSFDAMVSDYTPFGPGSFSDVIQFRGDKTQVLAVGLGFRQWGYKVEVHILGAGGKNEGLGAYQTEARVPIVVVGKITFGAAGLARADIWVNPADEAASPAYSAPLTVATSSLTRLTVMRYDDHAKGGRITTRFDNLRLGTDWNSVSPAPGSRASSR